jgi:formylglycine-generating enzyme required for sulfatase activity
MELADYSLNSHLQNRVLSDQPLYQMVAQVAEALDYLHTNGLVHQDLKPGNVLWVKNVWKVSDFGTVRDLQARSYVQTVNLAGTPLYMSPEAFRGVVSPARDMWSLGVMSAIAATGDVPEALPEDLLPSELQLLVQGCLQLDWRQRWTAKQALNTIAALKHSAPPSPTAQPQSQAHAPRIQLIAPDTAPTVPADLRPSPSPQQPAPKFVSPIVPPRQPAPKSPVIARPSPAPAPHQNYQDLLPGKVPLEMIAIPSGSFLMGSPDGEGVTDERPQHRVTVPQFYMGKYPITNAQWKAVMRTDPSAKWGEKFQGDRQPVIEVSWNDAQAFCQKLTQLTKRSYCLPSEAEWEYACRAGSQTKYSFGNDESQLKHYAWYDGISNGQTHPVGEKKPNAFGLYDMHGNVWEWCIDHWHDNYKNAPTDGSAWLNSENDNQSRIIRGGSWYSFPGTCRSAYRSYYPPDITLYSVGCRVVCSAPRALR